MGKRIKDFKPSSKGSGYQFIPNQPSLQAVEERGLTVGEVASTKFLEPSKDIVVPEEDTGGFVRTAASGMNITATEEAVRDTAAAITRYGAPIAAAYATSGMSALQQIIIQGAAAGGSELMARKLERLSTDPEFDTLWSDYKAGLAAMGLDMSLESITRGGSRVLKKVAGKHLIPSEMPAKIATAQKFLGKIEPDKSLDQYVKKWLSFAKNRPFAITFGQLNAEEKRFINRLEAIARSGWFSSGIMRGFDKRNIKKVEELFQRFVESRTKQMTDAEFGVFMKRIIGSPDNRIEKLGEMFIPAEAYNKYLYLKFDDALIKTGETLDGTQLRKYVLTVKDKDIRTLFNSFTADGLLPPLSPTKKMGKASVKTKTTKKQAGDVITQVDEVTQNAGQKVRKDAVKRKDGQIVEIQEVEQETLGLGELTEEQIAEAWSQLPVQDIDAVLRGLNASFQNESLAVGAKAFNKFLGQAKRTIQDPFDKFVEQIPELRDLYAAAKMFHGQKKDVMYTKVIETLRKSFAGKPSGVMHYFENLTGKPTLAYDKLIHLRNALYFQAATPRLTAAQIKALPSEYKAALSGVRESIGKGGKEAMHQAYEKEILRPIRHKFIRHFTDSDGILDHNGLLKRIKEIESSVPEYLNEVWGGPAQVRYMKEMLTTLSVLNTKQEGSIFIQLAQAGAVGSVLGGVAGYFTADSPGIGAGVGGAVGILAGPSLIAKMLTNPTVVREFTDGLKQGARSVTMAQALRKIAGMKAASTLWRDIEGSPEAAEYYTEFKPEGE